jgi:hypothetical protein
MKILSFDIGINNLSYCILSYEDENYVIHGWDILNINPHEDVNKEITVINKQIDKDNKKNNTTTKKKVKKKPSLNELSERIVSTFDSKKNFLECDYVIIENQPCMKNPTMKSIQMIVYSYFYIKGISNITNEILQNVMFISASNKLKVYDGPPIEINIKSKYNKNKKLGIEHTKYLLKNHEEYMSFFNSHTKKDDLADAFLQAAYFIHKRL